MADTGGGEGAGRGDPEAADRVARAVRAGVAVFDAGHYHPAHDAWEGVWLDLEAGTDDELLLHGLIQYTAAVHHGHDGNWEAVASLAESAGDYLDGLPADYRGVNLDAVRDCLAALAADPIHLERAGHVALTVDGAELLPGDLDVPAALYAAEPLAEAAGLDPAPVERGAAYARRDLADGDEGSRFVALVADFVREPDERALVYDRLSSHVERRRSREEDVDGLF